MEKDSAFDPKHLQTIAPERRDLLEELNLPPQVISFVRKNNRALLIGAVGLILAILGWSAYDHYTDQRRDEAAALLARAIETPAGEQQTELLRQVNAEYSGTGAALWSRVQLAHAARDDGNEEEAIAGYRAALSDIDADNPLAPLLHYSLGQSSEAAGQTEEALRHYQQLAATPGFAVKGLLAVARLHELQDRPAEALKAYEQLAALEEQPLLEKGFVANKLAVLRAQTPGADKQRE
jgi:predicted negative regulator of RcsB-dependent stress response